MSRVGYAIIIGYVDEQGVIGGGSGSITAIGSNRESEYQVFVVMHSAVIKNSDVCELCCRTANREIQYR